MLAPRMSENPVKDCPQQPNNPPVDAIQVRVYATQEALEAEVTQPFSCSNTSGRNYSCSTADNTTEASSKTHCKDKVMTGCDSIGTLNPAITKKELNFKCETNGLRETNSLSTCSHSHKIVPKTTKDVTIDYQEIVQRLHKLGNETVEEEEPTSTSNTYEKHVIISRDNGVPNSSPNLISEDGEDNQSAEQTGHLATLPTSGNMNLTPQSTGDEISATVVRNAFGISYIRYRSEHQMPDIMALISKDLSEPYSIYTYRYFIHNWPDLCFLAMDGSTTVGAIVCKLDPHKRTIRQRGYIAMLAVDNSHRRKKIGSTLVGIAIEAMIRKKADEVVLETEVTNVSALNLYEKLGFVRDKRLYKYYLNGVDAFRLKLWLT